MKVTKICRVCGKAYEVCRTELGAPSDTLRWQRVACSPSCGQKYFDRIFNKKADADIAAPEGTPVEESAAKINTNIETDDTREA